MSVTVSNIPIGSDQLVTLSGLINNVTAAYQNSATVNGALFDASRTTSIATFSLTYVASSEGDYQGVIPAATTATLDEGTKYAIRVTAVAGSFTRIFWASTTAFYG